LSQEQATRHQSFNLQLVQGSDCSATNLFNVLHCTTSDVLQLVQFGCDTTLQCSPCTLRGR
jgi:hypothetical protein